VSEADSSLESGISVHDLSPIEWLSWDVDLTNISPGTELNIDGVVLSTGGWSNSWDNHRVNWKAQHGIWEHGNQLLSKADPSEEDLAAAIIQFQRAVELRDKLLDKIYGFEQIPGRISANKYAIMADLGIIRPTLKLRLRGLRNSLMHEPDGIAITRDECELLSDTSWYYLKVTDRIAQQCATEVEIDFTSSQTRQAFITVTFEPGTWSIRVKADISPKYFLSDPKPGSLVVRVNQSEFVKYSGHLKFFGEVVGTDEAAWSLIQTFFNESVL
jgi:hypothetical protein